MGTGNRPLPIGISDFKRAVSEYYYVDKTMLIAELLDYKPLVALFTRPRRFGKSLNIDMLKVFLRIQVRIQVSILLEQGYGEKQSTGKNKDNIL